MYDEGRVYDEDWSRGHEVVSIPKLTFEFCASIFVLNSEVVGEKYKENLTGASSMRLKSSIVFQTEQ